MKPFGKLHFVFDFPGWLWSCGAPLSRKSPKGTELAVLVCFTLGILVLGPRVAAISDSGCVELFGSKKSFDRQMVINLVDRAVKELSKNESCEAYFKFTKCSFSDGALKEVVSRIPQISLRLLECNLSTRNLYELDHGRKLRTFVLDRGFLQNSRDLRLLDAMTDLQNLSLIGVKIPNEVRSIFFTLENLEVLDLVGCKMNFNPLVGLPNPEKLQHLDLSNTPLSSNVVTSIKRFKMLRTLGLKNTGCSGKDFLALPKLEQLEYLEFTPSRNPDDWMRAIFKQFAKPHSSSSMSLTLDFDNTSLSDLAFADSQIVPAAGTLLAANANIGDKALACLSAFPKLKSLAISGTNITDEGLSNLKHSEGLTILDISNTKVTDAGLSKLREAPSLERLFACGISGSVLPVDALSNLQEVDFAANKMSSQGLKNIGQLPKLQKLRLAHCKFQLHEDRLEALVNSPLYELDVSNIDFNSQDMKAVARMRYLTNLILRGSKINESMIKVIYGKHIRELDLSGCTGLNTLVCEKLARLGLQRLSVVGSDISKADVQKLLEVGTSVSYLENSVAKEERCVCK